MITVKGKTTNGSVFVKVVLSNDATVASVAAVVRSRIDDTQQLFFLGDGKLIDDEAAARVADYKELSFTDEPPGRAQRMAEYVVKQLDDWKGSANSLLN